MNSSENGYKDDKNAWRVFTIKITFVVLLFICGLFFGLFHSNKQLVESEYLARAKSHFDNIVLTRRWSAQYGGVYVEKKPGMESNPYLINPDIQAVSGKTYTLKNPALMTREISEIADKDGQYRFHITSLKPLNPANMGDTFERSSLEAFEKGKKESLEMITEGGRTRYRYMAPLKTEQPCLKCHAIQGYKGGEVRGGISVSFDVTESARSLERQKYMLISLFVVTSALLFGILYQMISKLNKKIFETQHTLALKSEELQIANGELQESQNRIMESLNCARVIQGSILPHNESFERLLSDWFTIYKPCDIVGGDLYWLREKEGRLLLAVIDCTGHGVPGAVMTMTVNSALNQVVDTICSDDPACILRELNRVLQETLHLRRDGESMVDAGLDIILCCIDPESRSMTCAGAGLSLYLLADGVLSEIKGARHGVGYSTSDPDFTYTNHVRKLDAATICYATTDGFFDESGGDKGFSFGRQRFKDLILQYAHHPLQQQKEYFEQALNEWRGIRKQRDDITTVGFRL